MRSKKENNNAVKDNKSSAKKYLILSVILSVVAIGGCGYFAYSWWQLREKTPEVLAAKAEAEKQMILKSIASIMYVPEEEPVIYKVDNENEMKNGQPFFQNIKNGDILLVYKKEGKAVIFRPTENKIVNSGAVNVDNPETAVKAPSETVAQEEGTGTPDKNLPVVEEKTTTKTTTNTTKKK